MFISKLCNKLSSLFHNQYQSSLEAYIVSKHPQDLVDIERYVKEYHQQLSKGLKL